VLRPDQAAYGFRYRAVQAAPRAHRCPIWLPTAPTDGRSRPVRLGIDLPPATAAGTITGASASGPPARRSATRSR
jgi:hypothetical protein